VKGILPSRAFLILLNTLVNPKIPIFIQQEPSRKSNSLSPNQHIPRKRSHMSACQ
jgi:hypothetical protein